MQTKNTTMIYYFIDNRKSSIVNNDPSLDPGFDEYDVYSSEDFEDHEDEFLGESKSINEDMSEEDYDEFFSIVDKIGPAINTAGGDMDDINGNLSHPYEDEDRIKIVFVSTVDKKDAKKFVKTVEAEIEKALQTTRFNRVRDIYVYQLSDNDLQMRVPASLRGEFSKKFIMFEIDIRASADLWV